MLTTAQKKLREAIEEFIREEWGIDPQLVLADWILITHHTGWNEDGDGVSKYGTVYMNGDMAPHQSVGLLSLIANRLQHDYNEGTFLPGGDDE